MSCVGSKRSLGVHAAGMRLTLQLPDDREPKLLRLARHHTRSLREQGAVLLDWAIEVKTAELDDQLVKRDEHAAA